MSSASKEERAELQKQIYALKEAEIEIEKSAASESELEKATKAVSDAYKDWQKAIEDVSEK